MVSSSKLSAASSIGLTQFALSSIKDFRLQPCDFSVGVRDHGPKGHLLTHPYCLTPQAVPAFAFQGRHFQFGVLVFTLSLSPQVFRWCVIAALDTGSPKHSSSPLLSSPAATQSELGEDLSLPHRNQPL